jgi:hypothetical protein
MEDLILQSMFWEQIHTFVLCSLLLFASCAYISILPWSKEELEKCNRDFLESFGATKYRPILAKDLLVKD